MSRLYRSDQMLVRTPDGRIWDAMEGGEVTSDGFEDLILQTPRETMDAMYIVKWMRRIGDKTAVFCTLLDMNGDPTGATMAYGAKVRGVRLASYSAQAADVQFDELILSPYKLEEL